MILHSARESLPAYRTWRPFLCCARKHRENKVGACTRISGCYFVLSGRDQGYHIVCCYGQCAAHCLPNGVEHSCALIRRMGANLQTPLCALLSITRIARQLGVIKFLRFIDICAFYLFVLTTCVPE